MRYSAERQSSDTAAGDCATKKPGSGEPPTERKTGGAAAVAWSDLLAALILFLPGGGPVIEKRWTRPLQSHRKVIHPEPISPNTVSDSESPRPLGSLMRPRGCGKCGFFGSKTQAATQMTDYPSSFAPVPRPLLDRNGSDKTPARMRATENIENILRMSPMVINCQQLLKRLSVRISACRILAHKLFRRNYFRPEPAREETRAFF